MMATRNNNTRCIIRAKRLCNFSSNEEFLDKQIVSVNDNFSIDNCMLCHRENIMSKDELATTLRENHAVNKEITTDERNYAKGHVQFKEKY